MIEYNNRISTTGGVQRDGRGKVATERPVEANDFEKLLRQQYARQQSRKAQAMGDPLPAVQGEAIRPIHFSKHALQRLEKRQIELGPEQNSRLENAVEAAAGKGACQSVVFMDGIAFIVNVQERTVVTALQAEADGSGASQPIFTNIDSAVLA